MRNNTVHFLFAALAFVCAASCAKEELVEDIVKPVVAAPVFTATIENTKTVLEGTKVDFETGNQISINGTVYTATVTAGQVVFDTAEPAPQPIESKYHAYYPHSLWNGGSPSLPNTYSYAAGKFDMPLYASHTYDSANPAQQVNLKFKHLCGFLAVTVCKDLFDYVSSVTVSTDKNLSGPFKVEENVAVLDGGAAGDYKKFVTVNISEESLRTIPEEGKIFYVPIPVANYSRLMITVVGTKSSTAKTGFFLTKEGKPGQIERNNLYNLTFKNNFNGKVLTVTTDTEEESEDSRY